jgi:hypothetical protein
MNDRQITIITIAFMILLFAVLAAFVGIFFTEQEYNKLIKEKGCESVCKNRCNIIPINYNGSESDVRLLYNSGFIGP